MAPTEMAILEGSAETTFVEGNSSYVHWGPVIAGGMTATALWLVIQGFGAAIGLSLSSTAPTWRDASMALTLLAGVYLIFAAILAYGLGGYIAGRATTAYAAQAMAVQTAADHEETEFRDGANGLLAWALATLLAVAITYAAAQSATRPNAPAPRQASAAEDLIAFDLDRLFRADQRPEGDVAYARAEAGRILLTASGHQGLQADDHDYLVRLVGRRTGLAPADATKRVDEVVAQVRDNIARARRTAVILAFMAAASALIGAVIAWGAAAVGGRHRDGLARSHLWDWRRTNARVVSGI
jgi:hypothetical protein